MTDCEQNQASLDFDIDYWITLAATQPEQFKQQQRDRLETMILGVPPELQKRLNGLKWRVEMEIRQAKTPQESRARIYRILTIALYGSDGLLETVRQCGEPAQTCDTDSTVNPRSIMPLSKPPR